MVLKCTFFNEKIEFILKLLKKYVLYIFSSLIMVSFFSCSVENNFIILTFLCILLFVVQIVTMFAISTLKSHEQSAALRGCEPLAAGRSLGVFHSFREKKLVR